MYCIKCGFKIPDGSKFCPVCGTPINLKLRVSNDNNIDSKHIQFDSFENQNSSTSESISILESISNSFVEFESISRSRSVSLSESISDLESVNDSISIFLSQSTSESISKSIFDSQSESVSSSEYFTQSERTPLNDSILTSESKEIDIDNISIHSSLENSVNDPFNSNNKVSIKNNDTVLDKKINNKYNSNVNADSESKESAGGNEDKRLYTKDGDISFCSNCGTRVTKEEEVCSNCGVELKKRVNDNHKNIFSTTKLKKMSRFTKNISLDKINSFIRRLLEKITQKWKKLNLKKKIGIVITGIVVISMLISYTSIKLFTSSNSTIRTSDKADTSKGSTSNNDPSDYSDDSEYSDESDSSLSDDEDSEETDTYESMKNSAGNYAQSMNANIPFDEDDPDIYFSVKKTEYLNLKDHEYFYVTLKVENKGSKGTSLTEKGFNGSATKDAFTIKLDDKEYLYDPIMTMRNNEKNNGTAIDYTNRIINPDESTEFVIVWYLPIQKFMAAYTKSIVIMTDQVTYRSVEIDLDVAPEKMS